MADKEIKELTPEAKALIEGYYNQIQELRIQYRNQCIIFYDKETYDQTGEQVDVTDQVENKDYAYDHASELGYVVHHSDTPECAAMYEERTELAKIYGDLAEEYYWWVGKDDDEGGEGGGTSVAHYTGPTSAGRNVPACTTTKVEMVGDTGYEPLTEAMHAAGEKIDELIKLKYFSAKLTSDSTFVGANLEELKYLMNQSFTTFFGGYGLLFNGEKFTWDINAAAGDNPFEGESLVEKEDINAVCDEGVNWLKSGIVCDNTGKKFKYYKPRELLLNNIDDHINNLVRIFNFVTQKTDEYLELLQSKYEIDTTWTGDSSGEHESYVSKLVGSHTSGGGGGSGGDTPANYYDYYQQVDGSQANCEFCWSPEALGIDSYEVEVYNDDGDKLSLGNNFVFCGALIPDGVRVPASSSDLHIYRFKVDDISVGVDAIKTQYACTSKNCPKAGLPEGATLPDSGDPGGGSGDSGSGSGSGDSGGSGGSGSGSGSGGSSSPKNWYEYYSNTEGGVASCRIYETCESRKGHKIIIRDHNGHKLEDGTNLTYCGGLVEWTSIDNETGEATIHMEDASGSLSEVKNRIACTSSNCPHSGKPSSE